MSEKEWNDEQDAILDSMFPNADEEIDQELGDFMYSYDDDFCGWQGE